MPASSRRRRRGRLLAGLRSERGSDRDVGARDRDGRATPGVEIGIALDIAASDFGRGYKLAKDGRELDSDVISEMLLGWLKRYPIVSIEDPLAEDDPDAFARFTKAADRKVDRRRRLRRHQRQADRRGGQDRRLQHGADQAEPGGHADRDQGGAGGGEAGRLRRDRLGTLGQETEDVTIVHLVGWGAPQLKVGSFTRSERMAKWNEGDPSRRGDRRQAAAGERLRLGTLGRDLEQLPLQRIWVMRWTWSTTSAPNFCWTIFR